ncbi:hypothetical protein [Nostoc sp.]|uniref:hypothetical protein n=1 Tax=Nostoc sp. TaxID=1180 RepID=UPI002FFB2D9D
MSKAVGRGEAEGQGRSCGSLEVGDLLFVVILSLNVESKAMAQEPHPQPPPRRRGGGYDIPHVIRKRCNPEFKCRVKGDRLVKKKCVGAARRRHRTSNLKVSS